VTRANNPAPAALAAKLNMPVEKFVGLCRAALVELQAEAKALRPNGFQLIVPRELGPIDPHELCTANPLLPAQARPRLTLAEAIAAQTYTLAKVPDPKRPGLYTDDPPPYKVMNNALRGKPPAPIPPPHDQTFQLLQQVIARTKPFPGPVPGVRGLQFDDPEALAGFVEQFQKNLGTNELIPLKGFISTGTTGIEKNFEGNVEFHIVVKQGLDMLPYSQTPQEREILLNHDTLVKTLSVVERGGVWEIKVEQVLARAV
jgi:hypothetical protein